MKNFWQILFLSSLFLTTSIYADDSALPPRPMPERLNKIIFPISIEQWVTTKTAKITLAVDAAVNEDRLVEARNEILTKMKQLNSNKEWEITIFDRTRDNSGLEKIHLEAQTRVGETALNNLRQQARAVSKPGQTYNILNIEYTPTLAELEAAKAELRAKIYAQAKDELARLNNAFPDQKYYLHKIEFIGDAPMPMNQLERSPVAFVKANVAPIPRQMLISNNLVLNANVVLASNVNNTLSSNSVSNPKLALGHGK